MVTNGHQATQTGPSTPEGRALSVKTPPAPRRLHRRRRRLHQVDRLSLKAAHNSLVRALGLATPPRPVSVGRPFGGPLMHSAQPAFVVGFNPDHDDPFGGPVTAAPTAQIPQTAINAVDEAVPDAEDRPSLISTTLTRIVDIFALSFAA